MAPTPSVSPPKRVQQMSAEGVEPPPQYFVKDKLTSVPLGDDIPVIDLNLLLSSPTFEAHKVEVNKLLSALSSWGAFQMVGHGMSSLYLDQIRSVSKEFFHQSTEEKEKYARASDGEGYGNDAVIVEGQVLDWCDRLFFNYNPKDLSNLQRWPQNPPNFRDLMQGYIEKVIVLIETLLKIFARSYNMEEDTFEKEIGENAFVQARIGFYPKCPKPDQILAVKAHADASAITILLQEQVEGLQFLKDGEWFGVPLLPDALVVNIGEQLTIMSNGIFKSPVHRVAANSERERSSLAVFYAPNIFKEIEPVKGLITSERPRMFKRIKNYGSINFKYFQSGKTAIDTLRLSASDE